MGLAQKHVPFKLMWGSVKFAIACTCKNKVRSSMRGSSEVLYRKVFLEILQNSQENICARASF